MYLYFCNHQGCAGHIKSWERCHDRLLAQNPHATHAQAQAAWPAAMAVRQGRQLARPSTPEQVHDADITWV